MAIKSMASKVRTCAELIHGEKREHLIRANVDEIVVRGESAGSILATTAASPGVEDSIKLLINNQDEKKVWRVPVPGRHVGKSVGEIIPYLKDRFGAMLLAVAREKEAVKLEDTLSEDSTFIDEFIRRKFEPSGKDFFGAKKRHLRGHQPVRRLLTRRKRLVDRHFRGKTLRERIHGKNHGRHRIGSVMDIRKTVGTSSLFKGLDDHELDEVLGITKEKRFPKGKTIMQQGERGDPMRMMVEGESGVSKSLTMKFGDDDFIRLLEGSSKLGLKGLMNLSELLINRLGQSDEDVIRLTTALSIALAK